MALVQYNPLCDNEKKGINKIHLYIHMWYIDMYNIHTWRNEENYLTLFHFVEMGRNICIKK